LAAFARKDPLEKRSRFRRLAAKTAERFDAEPALRANRKVQASVAPKMAGYKASDEARWSYDPWPFLDILS
jgi:hypothetical protein